MRSLDHQNVSSPPAGGVWVTAEIRLTYPQLGSSDGKTPLLPSHQMASSSSGTKAESAHSELAHALYARCAQQAPGTQFDQHALLALNVIPDGKEEAQVKTLWQCMQKLTNEGLFKLLTKDGRVVWRLVRKTDAAKYGPSANILFLGHLTGNRYNALNDEERLVFSYIESSGRDGIWTKTIKMRTNLHQTLMNRALKVLEGKNLIKPIKVVKYPARKYYMLASLQPSEDVTGGPWFTDGVLDEEFIHHLSSYAEQYIKGRSWVHSTAKSVGEKKVRITTAQAEEARAQELDSRKSHARSKAGSLLPLPPGYKGYPTVAEITREVNASGLSDVLLKESEMQTLLDVLCYDGRLMKVMEGQGYKAVRQTITDDGESGGNGLTEAPCGRCPVFNLCEEGGPVNARSCEYFQAWLES